MFIPLLIGVGFSAWSLTRTDQAEPVLHDIEEIVNTVYNSDTVDYDTKTHALHAVYNNVNYDAFLSGLVTVKYYERSTSDSTLLGEEVASLKDVYYYNSNRLGELDFVIEEDGKILPIEIKSGKDYYRHNAMDNVLNLTDYGISEGYVFCNGT